MKNHAGSVSLILTWAILAVVASLPEAARAAVPQMINYQGRLTDADGEPVDSATYGLMFSIYDAPIAGSELWKASETIWIEITDGLFSHLLGSTSPIPDSLANYDSLWLNVNVQGEDIQPRTPLVSVNFAFKALVAEHSLTSDSATHSVSADTAGHSFYSETSDLLGYFWFFAPITVIGSRRFFYPLDLC